MSLKRPQNQKRISDFFSKRFKSEMDDELTMNSEKTEIQVYDKDNVCQAKDLTPCCSNLNDAVNKKRACIISLTDSEDEGKESSNEHFQTEEHDIIPSSPTLELSEDFSDNSGAEFCKTSPCTETDMDTIPSTTKADLKELCRGVPKNGLRRLKPDDLDIVTFQRHLHITDSNTSSTKYNISRDVRMPFYVSGMQGQHSRWAVIKSSLTKCRDVKTGKDLENIIRSYNQAFSSKLDFSGFDKYLNCLDVNERLAVLETLTKMADLAIEAEHLCQKPIPILHRQKDQAITMSQHLIAALLANAFFCTFSIKSEASKLPSINFIRLFASDHSYRPGKYKDRSGVAVNKLRCIFHYFNRVTASMSDGDVTFHRQVLKDPDVPIWRESETSLTELYISSEGNIENEEGLLQVDFANMWVGGGALGTGCVQEEIRFMISPELIISRLFTEVLDSNECIIVTGCETFSTYRGYAETFEWSGDYVDQTSKDKFRRRLTQVVMIDAKQLQKKRLQFSEELVQRELNKAYCGFSCPLGDMSVQLPAVATGNWGCGAFGGDVHLKFLIQLMAAAVAQRDVCYFTFNDTQLMSELYGMHSLLKEQQSVTVGQLYKAIKGYDRHLSQKKRCGQPVQSLHDYIKGHVLFGFLTSSPEQTDDDDDD